MEANIIMPREKLLKYSASSLHDRELISLLLGSGSKGISVHFLSEIIEDKIKKGTISLTTLLSIDGINIAKAGVILAALELGKRVHGNQKTSIPSIFSPSDALPLLAEIRLQKKENFVALYLNSRNQLVYKETVSVGTLNGSLVHPREVFEPAIKHLAAQVLISHNHPSGDENPSDADITVTKRLVEAGKILGIEIMDHIIVTGNIYYSFKEAGRI